MYSRLAAPLRHSDNEEGSPTTWREIHYLRMDEPHASFHEIMPRLMPFQREGVEFALRQQGRVLIGDEMGLGKTLQAIAVAVAYRAQWPALIVVPASLKYSWADELEKWVPRLMPWDLSVVNSRNDVAGLGKPLVLATYGMFTETSPVMNHFREKPPRLVIVDECHALKSRDAARTKVLVPLLEQARHCILLSGTPALARPAELFTQVGALRRDLFGKSFWAYAKRYCNARRRFWGMDTTGASNLEELHGKLQEVMIRRLKRDVLQQLPAKRRQRVRVEIGAAQRKLVQPHLDALDAEFATLSGADADIESLLSARHEARRLLMAAYKATGEAKLPAVRDYVRCTLEGSDGKVLVFAYHRAVVQGLAQMAARAKVGFIRIDGDTPTCDRQAQVRRFQDDPSVRLAVLSMTAAGQGLTLTAASTVLFAELHWTPGVLVQAEDRAHRIGQECAVNVSYLMAKHSLDDHLWRCLARKVGVVSAALDGKRQKLQADLRDGDEEGGGASRKRPAPSGGGGGVDELASFAADTAGGDVGRPPPAKAARGGVLWFFKRQQGQKKAGTEEQGERGADKQAAPAAPPPASPLRCGACQRAGPGLRPARIVGWDGAHLCPPCASALGAAPGGDSGGQGDAPSPAPQPAHTPSAGSGAAAAEVIVVDEEAEAEAKGKSTVPGAHRDAATPAPYWFCVSQATGRAFLFDGDKLPLHASFGAEDMAALKAGGGSAPPALQQLAVQRPAVLAACRAFAKDWAELRAAERSALAGSLVRPPLRPLVLKLRAAAEKDRVPTTERYAEQGRRGEDGAGANAKRRLEYGEAAWREDDVASACDECGAAMDRAKSARMANTARTPLPPPGGEEGKARTGVCEDGQFALGNLATPPSHWWTRFCGLQCYRLHCLRRSGPEIRRQLFALERGVCQLCGLDAHALFERVRALAPPERLAELKRAGFSFGAGRKAGAILAAPKEGDLWQADHEVPVAEGGGACAIFNFRTLCTPCHQRETARLHQRLKNKVKADAARGTADIRTLFGGAARSSKR